mmetsp:Transcript_24259/g.55420  ORF Transcript_24259/g.55420 Transcript_24259/m.55420 type:complete len:737 (-) Transcript_24259:278-2488(-)
MRWLLAAPVFSYGLDCWAGDFNAAFCCDQSHGPQGNTVCWDTVYTYESCCLPETRPAKQGDEKNTGIRKKVPIDGPVVGIDLGTTYSCVAIFRGGRAEVIPNDQGNRITPSVVSYLETGERLVGEAAKNVLSDHPKQTVYDVKRLIGRGFEDRSVQMDKKAFPFAVVERSGRPHIEMKKDGKPVHLAPEEISALVLRKMKSIAESYLGEEVRHAVITVPAYFNDNQRSATMVAGEVAGLNVARIINEPTAAAIAFGLDRKRSKAGGDEIKVLVYDLGGGTFDVSVLTVADGVFQTLATCGNTHLGGEDFDRNVVKYLVEQFSAKYKVDPTKDFRAMQKLRVAVEHGKRALSTSVRTTIDIEDFHAGKALVEELSRSKFEAINAKLFQKTLEPVKRVLQDAGLKRHEIHEVVMVGGSTRIPKIQSLIQDFFDLPKPPVHKVNPDEAVAVGAAIQGGILWEGSAMGGALVAVGQQTWDLVLIDVTPLSLGIELEGGSMAVIIERNTMLPAKKVKTYTTVYEGQASVYIPIFEGERPIARKNNRLGSLLLSGIPMAPAGIPQIDVTFKIDSNGILQVTAMDQATKKASSVSLSADKGRLSDEDVEKMVKDAQKYADKDKAFLMRNDARVAFRAYLNSVSSTVVGGAVREKLDEDEIASIESAVAEAQAWLQESGTATAEEIADQRRAVEGLVNPVVTRVYGRGGGSTADSGSSESDDEDEDTSDEDAFYDQDDILDDEL